MALRHNKVSAAYDAVGAMTDHELDEYAALERRIEELNLEKRKLQARRLKLWKAGYGRAKALAHGWTHSKYLV
jgi:hypothetical protein